MAQQRSKAVLAAAAVGALLLVVGVTAFLAGGASLFGWFGGDAPSQVALRDEGVTLVRPVQWWGMLIGGLGLLLLSGTLGFALGRRRRRRGEGAAPPATH